MERHGKDARQLTQETETDEASPPPASALSDFLARGLRESQRPPAPVRESQRPALPAGESAAPVIPAPEPEPVEAQAETAATANEAAEPSVDAAPDGPVSDRASVRPQTVSVPGEDGESESDYVVPVARPSRPRLVAGAIAAGALILVIGWWISRERKVPPHQDLPNAASAPIAHEPVVPPPPPLVEAVEANESAEVDTGGELPKNAGTPATSDTAPSVVPPGGPNVARYPDLPTPVLIQLEKDQEEAKKSK